MSVERDIGELKEQGRWFAAKIERMDSKLDTLMEDRAKLRVVTAMVAAIVTTVVTALFEVAIAVLKHG